MNRGNMEVDEHLHEVSSSSYRSLPSHHYVPPLLVGISISKFRTIRECTSCITV